MFEFIMEALTKKRPLSQSKDPYERVLKKFKRVQTSVSQRVIAERFNRAFKFAEANELELPILQFPFKHVTNIQVVQGNYGKHDLFAFTIVASKKNNHSETDIFNPVYILIKNVAENYFTYRIHTHDETKQEVSITFFLEKSTMIAISVQLEIDLYFEKLIQQETVDCSHLSQLFTYLAHNQCNRDYSQTTKEILGALTQTSNEELFGEICRSIDRDISVEDIKHFYTYWMNTPLQIKQIASITNLKIIEKCNGLTGVELMQCIMPILHARATKNEFEIISDLINKLEGDFYSCFFKDIMLFLFKQYPDGDYSKLQSLVQKTNNCLEEVEDAHLSKEGDFLNILHEAKKISGNDHAFGIIKTIFEEYWKFASSPENKSFYCVLPFIPENQKSSRLTWLFEQCDKSFARFKNNFTFKQVTEQHEEHLSLDNMFVLFSFLASTYKLSTPPEIEEESAMLTEARRRVNEFRIYTFKRLFSVYCVIFYSKETTFSNEFKTYLDFIYKKAFEDNSKQFNPRKLYMPYLCQLLTDLTPLISEKYLDHQQENNVDEHVSNDKEARLEFLCQNGFFSSKNKAMVTNKKTSTVIQLVSTPKEENVQGSGGEERFDLRIFF